MSAIELVVVTDAEALAASAAEHVVRAASAVAHARPFRLALAGGSTPKRLYAKLAADTRIDWQNMALFWGDERVVPADHEKSNYRMVREVLLDHVPIPAAQIHRIEIERGAAEAASHYFAIVDEQPLDLVLLGMGDDGHTASIFPGATRATGVAVTRSPVPPAERISLALDVINRAHEVVMLVAGANKAARLAEIYTQWQTGGVQAPGQQAPGQGEPVDDLLPAAMVRPERLCWMVDEAAASALPQLKGGAQ